MMTAEQDAPVAIICGGGSFPFAVADAAVRGGKRVVLFAIRGWADAERVKAYAHHWVALGQFGRIRRLIQSEGCRDVTFIGNLVRPALRDLRLDWETVRLLPRLAAVLRGGDDQVLSGVSRIFEERGFRLVGAHEIASEILVAEGTIGHRQPTARETADISRGLAVLAALAPFDIGQGVVVADDHVLAVEAAEGTDEMLARLAELRRQGRIRYPVGVGVLVKAPKRGQDRRFDLPAIGPRTVAGVVRAGLAGLAVVADGAIVAEPDLVVAAADKGKVFVVAVRDVDARP